MIARRTLLAGALGLMLWSCEFSKSPKDHTDQPKEASGVELEGSRAVKHTATVALQMDIHRKAARHLMDAIVTGDFPALQNAAGRLSVEHWTPALKGDWKVHQQALQAAAGTLASTQGLAEAQAALGQLGQSCADCHRVVGRVPALSPPVEPSPPAEPSSTLEVRPVMREHFQASLWMWHGLTGPSDVAWKNGTELLKSADWVRSDAEDIEVLVRRVDDLGTKAQKARGAERGEVMGVLLSTCGECHNRLGVSAQVRAFLKVASADATE